MSYPQLGGPMSGTVLVTGGFGLVGSETVKRLAADGRRVVAADLDTPANVKAAKKLPSGVEFRWADLTDREQVERLVSDIAPEAIIHLAAIIAPAIYRMPKVARRVNVDATKTLVGIAEAQPESAAIRPRVEQCGVRSPQSAPHPLAADGRRPDAALRHLQRNQGRSRRDRAVLEPGMGGAAVRRGAHHRFVGATAEHRRHVLRERAAE